MDISKILKGAKKPPAKPEMPAPPMEPGPPSLPAPPVSLPRSAPQRKFHRSIPNAEDMEKARELYARVLAAVREMLAKVSLTKRLESHYVDPLRRLAGELGPKLQASPTSFLMYLPRGTADDYLVGKHANTGVLAGRLGLQLGFGEEEVRRLFLCGWLHDIGLAVIERLDLEPRLLAKNEKAYLMGHCQEALALLLGDLPEQQYLVEACMYHHERLDGSGYPKGLKGAAIPPFARILAVAESYESLSHVRPYRDRILPHEAMKQVVDMGGQQFDEGVVKALLQSLSIYPVGGYVELNNKTIARVAGVNEDMPTRPLLLPIFDSSGHPVEDGSFLDLSATPLVRIQRAVDETTLELADPKTLLQLRAQRWWNPS